MRRFRQALRGSADYATRAEATTADGFFFGKRTILSEMLLGDGEYRRLAQGLTTSEFAGDVVSAETAGEVDAQLDVPG